ncbi:FHA domain-containing protein [Nocardia sp. NBC_01503]|uniref:FHA domain-containing protein n=1 Tax=Nocardia sp. NBC_01503 TaxID=2975997 RepID=UPI002E7B7451|nr:FHA domain-containing protein [Nocardia sp. NBC_01503]WTL33858.1 FHA domain-containing protein [Nocardia sp. NBC_01503]
MDRQVEVVAGPHVVIRAAGAVILVAHRERGALNADARAAVAGRALADLVLETTEQAPDGPGRLIARQATRWLMKEAERISPGVPIEFGILSAADTGGVAIFLHGSVTAVLSGRTVEYYRGSDAAFTVDRVAAHPEVAAALFAEDAKRRVPELPERGIGSLASGIALAGGAIVWFEGEPAHTWVPRRFTPGAWTPQLDDDQPTQAEVPPPTAAFDPEPERIPLDPNLTPTRTSNRIPVGLDLDFDSASESDSATAGYDPQRESHSTGPGYGSPVGPGPGDGADGYDPHHAPTEMGGTNPAPKPDPSLQRRLEATAKATALTFKVLGFKCARAHPSDPRSAFCSVCGMPVDQTQQVAEVIRPPLGMLILDDGMTYMLAADAVVGRDPEQSEAARAGLVPLKIDDSSGGMSRAHAEIRLINWDVTVVDRGSTNGTRVRLPGYRDWVRLQANQPMILIPGAEIMLGNRVLRLEPVAPPPFG